ncbi:MAG: hypothetical protein M3550_09150, partial [Actinomycetota bacterium]|nr:hypothetical protein [Actinomycetota bacterium]
LRERAAGSEDAFDAAVSALSMAEHLSELEGLPRLDADDPARIEGAIWVLRDGLIQDGSDVRRQDGTRSPTERRNDQRSGGASR